MRGEGGGAGEADVAEEAAGKERRETVCGLRGGEGERGGVR